ncbi:conserved exported hypothetical protein [Candidatus Sulfopaludibacter sp. SbA6]|nr:conserved exported hypothetical protein [Candidatus Sulfopaludibacter sp. SbA6]
MKNFWSRRDFLFQSGGGISGLALAYLLNQDGLLGATPGGGACDVKATGYNPYAPRKPHFAPRATHVISLFMSGGPSHVDTFDPKPALSKYAGQPLTGKGEIVVRQGDPGPLMPSPFQFRKYGQCGMDVCELFPLLSQHVDEMAFLRSVYGKSNDHVQATYELNTGKIQMGLPSVGSWVTYGLGSENQSLPAFVVIYDRRGGPLGGPSNWSAGYMPAAYQATVFRASGDPIIDLKPPAEVSPAQQRDRLDLLAKLNELDLKNYPGSSELAARISSYELAFRMQGCAPEAVDVNSESEATRKLYGLDDQTTEPFGRQCLMARRLVERGVRFVQLYHGGLGQQNRDTWDAHDDLKDNHTRNAAQVDRPISGLLTDLKARGLLDSTLLVWHGEFGRMPISQKGVGRDHNPGTMTMWMAGAKIKGQIIGSSDEFGYKAEQQPIAIHDLHATMLHLLGIDHTRLTYLFNGRNMRLTDVYGELIPQIVA